MLHKYFINWFPSSEASGIKSTDFLLSPHYNKCAYTVTQDFVASWTYEESGCEPCCQSSYWFLSPIHSHVFYGQFRTLEAELQRSTPSILPFIQYTLMALPVLISAILTLGFSHLCFYHILLTFF